MGDCIPLTLKAVAKGVGSDSGGIRRCVAYSASEYAEYQNTEGW